MGPVKDHADHISQESVETTLEAGMEDTCRPFDQACPDCCPCLSEMFGWCSNYAQVLNMYNYTICTALCTYTLQDIYTDMYVRVLVPTLDRYSKEEDSESLVDSLFEEKVKAGLWRYHPEFPQKKD